MGWFRDWFDDSKVARDKVTLQIIEEERRERRGKGERERK